MKKTHPELFNELKRSSANLASGWLLTRKDGKKFGFTSADVPFTFNGVEYKPTNSFAGSASVSKNDLSVDNMSVIACISDEITDADLRGGVYENAKVEMFWLRPDKPEWGTIPIQGGTIGEMTIKNGQYETELRSASQKLQQPFGRVYTVECDTTLGSSRCRVVVDAKVWTPNTTVTGRLEGDATVGTVVRPTVYNGFWYECTNATSAIRTNQTYDTLPPDLKDVFKAVAYVFAQSAMSKTVLGQGGIVADGALTIKYGKTGATEPAWPTSVGSTVNDGSATWRAILARQMPGVVSGVFNRASFESETLAWVPAQYFQYGLLTWTKGRNAGFQMEVRMHAKGKYSASFELTEAMPFAIAENDEFIVRAGCAGTRNACKGWGNIYNMQAFPDMPTEDKALTSPNYSSQGEKNKDDGSGK